MLTDITGDCAKSLDELFVGDGKYAAGQYTTHYGNRQYLLVLSDREVALFITRNLLDNPELILVYAGDDLSFCVSQHLSEDDLFSPIEVREIRYKIG